MTTQSIVNELKKLHTESNKIDVRINQTYTDDQAITIENFVAYYHNEWREKQNDMIIYNQDLHNDPDGILRKEAKKIWKPLKKILTLSRNNLQASKIVLDELV